MSMEEKLNKNYKKIIKKREFMLLFYNINYIIILFFCFTFIFFAVKIVIVDKKNYTLNNIISDFKTMERPEVQFDRSGDELIFTFAEKGILKESDEYVFYKVRSESKDFIVKAGMAEVKGKDITLTKNPVIIFKNSKEKK